MRKSSLVLSAIAILGAACADEAIGAPDADPAREAGDTAPKAPSPPTSTEPADRFVLDVAPRTPLRPTSMTVTAETIDVAGLSREYVLATPDGVAESYPLVLVLHPDTMDASSMRAAVRFERISWQDAIVAYPSGLDRTWDLYAPSDTNPDEAFLVALVDSLKARLPVDQVFGMGFSSGAFMLSQLACRRPSLFRAIAPSAGGAPYEPFDPDAGRWENGYVRCAGQSPGSGPAVMIVHGTADDVVGFDSGDFSARYWAYVNGCEPTRSAPVSPPPCVMHDGCPAERPVVFCAIDGLGHSVWGEATTAAWAFFRSL